MRPSSIAATYSFTSQALESEEKKEGTTVPTMECNSDAFIFICLSLKFLLHLPYRKLQGFLQGVKNRSLFQGLSQIIPKYAGEWQNWTWTGDLSQGAELLKRSLLKMNRILADGAYCTKILFKTDQRRHCEMIIKVNLINRMRSFGLPKSLKCTP